MARRASFIALVAILLLLILRFLLDTLSLLTEYWASKQLITEPTCPTSGAPKSTDLEGVTRAHISACNVVV